MEYRRVDTQEAQEQIDLFLRNEQGVDDSDDDDDSDANTARQEQN
jgi:hypothetical protein